MPFLLFVIADRMAITFPSIAAVRWIPAVAYTPAAMLAGRIARITPTDALTVATKIRRLDAPGERVHTGRQTVRAI